MRIVSIRAVVFLVSTLVATAASESDRVPPKPIEVQTPVYPEKLFKKDVEGWVELSFEVDEAGAARNVRVKKSSNKRFEETCIEAISRWRFEPDDTASEATGRLLNTTVVFRGRRVQVKGVWFEREEMGTLPKIIKQVAPRFPEGLEHFGNSGRVILRFVVDKHGNVRDPRVVTATHPGFEANAIEAVLKWKFSPGTKNGKPVAVNIEQSISFNAWLPGSAESFAVEKNRKSKIPPELQVDTQARPRNTVYAVHPYESAIKGARGSAEVRMLIGANGRVLATTIKEASSPDFGLSLAAAMESWTFDPALRDNKPALSVVNRKHDFEQGTRDSALDPATVSIAVQIRRGKFAPANALQLDAPLKPSFAAPPVYPTALNERGVAGSAKIEVIVDSKGRAVLPRIVEASEPEFGWAAATAAQRWRFEPPKVKGKPVEVRVMIPFKFVPPEPETEEGKPAT